MGIKAIIRAINSFNFIPTKTFNNVIDGMIKETYDFLSSLKCVDTNNDGMISIKEMQKVIVPFFKAFIKMVKNSSSGVWMCQSQKKH